jgi:predicted RNA binding protein YcfA (HicA-like mRNA interferase family)
MALTNREMEKQLRLAGWVFVRQRGSHRHYRHPSRPAIVTVSGKPRDVPTPGILAEIRRSTGLPLR